jgi:hypothetical protein
VEGERAGRPEPAEEVEPALGELFRLSSEESVGDALEVPLGAGVYDDRAERRQAGEPEIERQETAADRASSS